ncbi:MAG: carboxypeptidase-like regulatory domain-containing protein [Flavobacteriales bacterium]|nr:carboxypeptidase-like regulatory domain-containing protein [Flavobacteriales bacterium]MBK9194264.1 carboxypeptidase-like regulatory domain-containing protein [Flavobacteriales bacterium]
MNNLRSLLFTSTVVLLVNHASAQADTRTLIQFSGVVVTGDSLAAVPFTNVLIKNSYRGTMSDVFGYFSFVAQEGDTLLFSAIGFKRSQYVVPTDLTEKKYSIIHQLESDTILLKEFTVYPWPSREQFDQAFLALDLPDDDYQRSLKNLSPAEMMQRMENLPPDAYQSFSYAMAQDRTKLYQSGGTPSINLFNPIAWAQFLQAWRNGDFKKKK